MEEKRKRRLKCLLPFEALEAPKWRKTEDVPVREMVAKITEYSKEWEGQKKDNYESDLIEQVYQDFLVDFIGELSRAKGAQRSTMGKKMW